jgi:universal stress protein A
LQFAPLNDSNPADFCLGIRGIFQALIKIHGEVDMAMKTKVTRKLQRTQTHHDSARRQRGAESPERVSETSSDGPLSPPINLHKILVPIDFSESSRKALHYAVRFARQFNAEILMLHVAEPLLPVSPGLMGVVPLLETEPVEVTAKRRLNGWRDALPADIAAQTMVRSGMPSHYIIQAAEDNVIDMIVLGRRGRTGLAHLLLGGGNSRVCAASRALSRTGRT